MVKKQLKEGKMKPTQVNFMKKSKRSTTAAIKSSPDSLRNFLNQLLDPVKDINDPETIDWCRWLMAGGQTPEEFANELKQYDNATICGLVWTVNFVAYRCRTCRISPCMSLCAECFQNGNHDGHDFNMFRSQAGGACDCGDMSVMKESGFCNRHGPKQAKKPSAPDHLMCLPNAIMPRLIFRLIQHMRENSNSRRNEMADADAFLNMLHDFSSMGAAMTRVMTTALTDPQIYKELTEWSHVNADPDLSDSVMTSAQIYHQALKSLPNPEFPDEYKNCPALQEQLIHNNFVEELMFWTVKFEFPQQVVCLLLNMLPDLKYKEPLTRAFVLHYSRIPMMLEKSSTSPDTLSNRVVHVSVQLFSNESLVLKMTNELSLLHVMVISLKYMMSKILIPNTLHDPTKNFHLVIDCGHDVMKEHCFWPLVSDLSNVLSHQPVAYKFMSDNNLLEMWFNFLSMFQGMNVNRRELYRHVEFEPSTYYAAFTVELEGSAYPLWALVSHLKDESTLDLTKNVLNACISALQDWFDAINFTQPVMTDHRQVSFHLPLHRYLAILMNTAIKYQGVTLKQVLPPPYLLELVYQHPLRLQVAFYEILNGMWVRNGLQIRGQMMTYVQCNFCNSMVDEDLYLLQVCATQTDPEKFLMDVLKAFRVVEALSIVPYRNPASLMDYEFAPAMLESCLTFLAILVHIRSNLGVSDTWVTKLEMVTLLCTSDKTHSQLSELMPERCGPSLNGDFDDLLAEIADYTAPSKMRQGMYSPKPHVWEELYDPIHVFLRAVQKWDFQISMDRFTDYIQQSGKFSSKIGNIWPPFRAPAPCGDAYEDPRKVLQSRIFHAVIFCILYKAIDRRNVPEHALALTLYLLEMAIVSSSPSSEFELCQTECCNRYEVKDNDLASFYEQDWLAHNLRTVIHNIVFIHEPEVKSYCTEVESYVETNDSNQETLRESDSLNIVSYEETSSNTPVPAHLADLPSTSQSNTNFQLVLVNQSASTSSGNKSSIETNQEELKYKSENTVMTHVSRHVNESIISLLLKLHAQLLGTPDSYVMGQQAAEGLLDSRIGDGPFFVAKVLDRIASLDEICRDCIIDTKKKLWMRRAEEDSSEAKISESKEREERKRKAKKRQQELIEAFARKQEQFMKKATEAQEEYENMEWKEENTAQLEYDCVICGLTAPSTKDNPIGLIVLVQATSVLGYQRKPNANEVLPMSDEEKPISVKENSRATEFDRRVFELSREFDANSWLLSINLGWEGGVYVQTCGHHAHMDCLRSYCQYLRDQERHQSVAIDKREYSCPLCRQLANSALPLVPELGEISSVVRNRNQNLALPVPKPLTPIIGEICSVARTRPQTLANQIMIITLLLKNYSSRPESSNLLEAMGKSMEDMTKCTHMRFKKKTDHPSPHCLFLFVSSIARTNLEIEIMQKGGSFLTGSTESTLIPKRSCIVPLLHVLAVHGRILAQWPVWLTWHYLTQLPLEESGTQLANIEKEVPLLLRDPVALLIQFLLFLPLNLDQSYFNCIVKCLYNLLYFQILSQISVNMTEFEREGWRDPVSNLCGEIKSVDTGLAFVISQLDGTSLYVDSGGSSCSEENTSACKQAVEEKVQSLCLPFLRIAALLRHHLFNEEIPEVRTESTEFVRLVYFLELVTEGMNWSKFNASVGLGFAEQGLRIPRMWFRELATYIERSQRTARNFLSKLHINWHPPKLLTLPHHYDKIFQYYHKKQCSHCHSVPREACICLICGTLVCLKEDCCKTENKREVVQHSLDCGAGTGVFLAISSTYIVVLRGMRACNWGSVYLDSFGEEDRDLKRGKPLYLCSERYQLLQEQWIALQFDHNIKKWFLHNNNL